jgi:phosphomannomutase
MKVRLTENLAKLFGSSGVRGLVNVDVTPRLACFDEGWLLVRASGTGKRKL